MVKEGLYSPGPNIYSHIAMWRGLTLLAAIIRDTGYAAKRREFDSSQGLSFIPIKNGLRKAFFTNQKGVDLARHYSNIDLLEKLAEYLSEL